jgi:serine O-acetyltransferase
MNFRAFIFCVKKDLLRLSQDKKIKYFYLLHPRFLPVFLIRLSCFFYSIILFRLLSYVISWINFYLYGIECTPKINIGYGLLIPHPNGIVLGAKKIGSNVTIFQGVTIGAKYFDHGFTIQQRPAIGDNVVIGAGAKILGEISIEDNVVIGANSVVLKSFSRNQLIAGIPAKVIRKKNSL